MTAPITTEDLRKLVREATPGPWLADGDPQNRIVWSPNGNRVCFMAHSSGLNDARDIATSNLAAAAPDLARTVIALHERVERLARALVDQNDFLRSAMQIAKREGVEGKIGSTNWDAYYNRVAVSLQRHHDMVNEARAILKETTHD